MLPDRESIPLPHPAHHEHLPVVVIGAGPVGLAAAAHLHTRGLEFRVLEAGEVPGASVLEWGHVPMFSPWGFNVDPAAEALLRDAGWSTPDPGGHPTGQELVERYLDPLAAHSAVAGRLRLRHRVTGVTREGRDRMKGDQRDETPLVVRFHASDGTTGRFRARAVLDASGTWTGPRPLGADGLPAPGELEANPRIRYGIPDILGAERHRYTGRRVAVVGGGHSAAHAVLDLVRLQREASGTRVVWVVRGQRPARAFGGGADDALEARGELGLRVRRLLEEGAVELATGFGVAEVQADGSRLLLRAADGRTLDADEVVAATGLEPDLSFLREVRLDLDPVTEAPRALGPLIDPNLHSCGTVPPHGEAELRHPEPGLYVVGMKSYGRAPTFLLRTGYEQVRSVVAWLAGDVEAARNVELKLPETGVCGAVPALDPEPAARAEAPAPTPGTPLSDEAVPEATACCASISRG